MACDGHHPWCHVFGFPYRFSFLETFQVPYGADSDCLPVYTSSEFWLLSGDLFSDNLQVLEYSAPIPTPSRPITPILEVMEYSSPL